MTIDLTNPIFHDEDAAREHIERARWPNGVTCPHCGGVECVTRMQGAAHRAGTFQCNQCREQFTVMVGSVMERSHVPMPKWVLAFYLMAASKKGISAHQLHRTIHVTYKTAWFMCHRIREAMRSTDPTPMGGEGKVIEADEMYQGRKKVATASPQRKGRAYIKKGKAAEKRPIFALVERGGEARAFYVPVVTAANLREKLVENTDRQSRLHTDESNLYPRTGEEFAAHETVNHGAKEFARGDGTTNSVESFFGIFKRGMTGVYQHCGEQHLQRYLDEFSFRYSTWIKLGVDDAERAARAIRGADGKRLTYRGPGSVSTPAGE
jgi:transposase-like protein